MNISDIDIKRAIQYIALFLCIGMIFILTEANFKLMSNIIDASDHSNWYKSFIYGSAGMVIIVYYRQIWVKVCFVLMDMSIIWTIQYFESTEYHILAPWIYPVYSALILFGIGKIATDLYLQIRINVFKQNRVKVSDKQMKISYENTIKKLNSSFKVTTDNYDQTIDELNSKLNMTEQSLSAKIKQLKQAEMKLERIEITKKITNLKKGGKGDENTDVINLKIRLDEIHELINV